MHLRPHAVSAGSVACRVVDSPVGTLDARSCHALDSHGSPHNAAVPGLEVSRGDVLQHQLVQAQLCHQPLQLRVLLLQLLQPPGLVHPQTAILFTPPELGLLHDSRFLTRLWRRLSVRHGYFDLPQQVHYLFRTMLLASRHLPLLLFQFVSTPLAQIEPGTPRSWFGPIQVTVEDDPIILMHPRGKVRGRRRYYRKLALAPERVVIQSGNRYDFMHWHVDWHGLSNLSWQERRSHLVALFAVFHEVLTKIEGWSEPHPCWLQIDAADS